MHQEKRTTSNKEAALKALRHHFKGTDTDTQRRLLLAALEQWPTISTLEARQLLDILHPAGRIKNLRDEGHVILTLWADERTEAGVPHRIGMYALAGGAQAPEAAA